MWLSSGDHSTCARGEVHGCTGRAAHAARGARRSMHRRAGLCRLAGGQQPAALPGAGPAGKGFGRQVASADAAAMPRTMRRECWAQNPLDRPSFQHIIQQLRWGCCSGHGQQCMHHDGGAGRAAAVHARWTTHKDGCSWPPNHQCCRPAATQVDPGRAAVKALTSLLLRCIMPAEAAACLLLLRPPFHFPCFCQFFFLFFFLALVALTYFMKLLPGTKLGAWRRAATQTTAAPFLLRKACAAPFLLKGQQVQRGPSESNWGW